MLAATGAGGWTCEPFGAGKFSDVFAAERGDDRLVLRVAPPDDVLQLFYETHMMRREPAIHEQLAAETTVPVPQIIHHDFSRSIIDRDWLVMERLAGEPLSTMQAVLSPQARTRALKQWGGYIAQVHQVRAADGLFGYRGDADCMEPQTTWPAAFEIMYRRLLDDVVACEMFTPEQADDQQALLTAHLDAFDNARTPLLLHGDIWVTNLLVDRRGNVTGVLDFDRACWGDVEWDLAIAEYCGVTGEPFWKGYSRRIEPTRAASIRRMFYLLYEHQKYIVISMSTRRSDTAGARRYGKYSLAVADRFRRTGQPGF